MHPFPTFSGELTPGAIGIFMILGYFLFNGLTQWRDSRKLTAEERQANREGFSRQAELLMLECARLREWGQSLGDQLHSLRTEYDEHRKLCFRETDQLRSEIRVLEAEIIGHKRNLDLQSSELAKLKAKA